MDFTLPPPGDPALRELLERYSGPEADPPPLSGGRLAAVSIVLRPAPGSRTDLLLVRRAVFDGDPWSGHMALPGGRKDPTDPSLLDTAIRETREEVGLDLDRAGRMLGHLEVMEPAGPSIPPLTVLPFVFRVPPESEARVASSEIAEVHWVPVSHLRDNINRIRFRFQKGGIDRLFPAIDVDGHPVWGLTHRILTDFLARIDHLRSDSR